MANIYDIIDKLLKEPITHYLGDSGGAYGYKYEKNQKEGYLTGLNPVEEYTNGNERTIEITIPIYDFLTYNLSKSEDTSNFEKELFKAFKENGFEPYEIYEVEEYLKSTEGIEETGFLPIKYYNTYNGEEFLSQTLLFCVFSANENDYVLLEVHNGCDVRSGYTSPQLFKIEDTEYFIVGQSDRFCQCECGLNDYTIYGSDDPSDSSGNYIAPEEIYKRTYIDNEGNLRCKECNSIIEGGFIRW
jgi:hypothetical protein